MPTDPPPGLMAVPVPKALLPLTYAEYVPGLLRGKWWKRRHAAVMRAVNAATPKTSQAPR
jgi:hypothetical protein